MNLSDINFQEELVAAINGTISIGQEIVPVYGQSTRPSSSYPSDFIDVTTLSSPTSVSENHATISGSLEFTIYCKLNPDGTAKNNRIKKVIEQVEGKLKGLLTEHYFYKLSPYNFLAPTITDINSGYSYTTIYLDWRSR